MPLSFLRKKKIRTSTENQTRVIARNGKREEMYDSVEAGLFPARVASRQGVKRVKLVIQITLLTVIAIVVASYFGLIEPVRKLLQPLQVGNGGLVVSSDYVRTQVSLNGKLLGQTPFSSETIPAGRHQLSIEVAENPTDFFQKATMDIVIYPGNTTFVKANPAPDQELFGYTVVTSRNRAGGDPLLVVKALPDDVQIRIDGNIVGSAPFVSESVTEGPHQIQLDKTGYKPVLLDITIDHRKVIEIEGKLYQYQVTIERE